MIIKPNPSLGVPIYLQLVEQVKHAIEIGALRAGDQLPSIRPLAEELVINANTVAKAWSSCAKAPAHSWPTRRARSKAAPRDFAARSRSSRKPSASCARVV